MPFHRWWGVCAPGGEGPPHLGGVAGGPMGPAGVGGQPAPGTVLGQEMDAGLTLGIRLQDLEMSLGNSGKRRQIKSAVYCLAYVGRACTRA